MAIIAIKVHMSAAAFVRGPVFLIYPVIHELEKRKGEWGGGGGVGAIGGGCQEGGWVYRSKKKKKKREMSVWFSMDPWFDSKYSCEVKSAERDMKN